MQKSQLPISWYSSCLCQSKWEAGFGSFPFSTNSLPPKQTALLVELTQCYIVLGTAGLDNWERRTWFCGTVGESKAQDGKEDLCFSTAYVEEAVYSAGLSTGYQQEELCNGGGKKCAHIAPRIVIGWATLCVWSLLLFCT